ncbi:MAG: hypothetical protein ACUVRO_14945, partial [Armatimonadota bacterium]
MIGEPGVAGIGGGDLQVILLVAKICGKRSVCGSRPTAACGLYTATGAMLREGTDLGGRNAERNLYNGPGKCGKILNGKAAGQPCPDCETPIEKTQYFGRALYLV